ncbi:hypothetical protein [Actinomadura nitritigenes]|uniref:hypothetical protein n=1 Tax=Actinomadura nitritigenes TaxID=134602 RepID=UPI003D8E1041
MSGLGNTVRLPLRWAVWGKRSADLDYSVQATSGQPLSRRLIEEVMHRYATGTPDELPTVTISWFVLGQETYIGLALQEWTQERDRVGRMIAATRYFCLPYERIRQDPVSYEALFDAVVGARLQSGVPLEVKVPRLAPHAIGERATFASMATSALLLGGEPVRVVGAEGIPLRARLRYIDTVTALLPYGLRARFSATTWAGSTTEHHFRLAFSGHASPNAQAVSWGVPPTVTGGRAEQYARLLAEQGEPGSLAVALARETNPMSFRERDLAAAIDVLASERRRAAKSPADRAKPAVSLLLDCAAALDDREPERLTRVLSDLAFLARTAPPEEPQRSALLGVAHDQRLLAPARPLSRYAVRRCEVLVALLWPDPLTPEDVVSIIGAAGGPHDALIEAMLRCPASTPIVTLDLARNLGQSRLESEIGSQESRALIESVAAVPEPWLVDTACAELTRRRNDRDLGPYLRLHRFLSVPLAVAHSDRPVVQLETLCALLAAVYGPTLTTKDFEDALTTHPALPTEALLAAAVLMHGDNAGRPLLDVVLPRILANIGFPAGALTTLTRSLKVPRR